MTQPETLTAADIDSHVGGRLRAIRRYAGMSQSGLADRLGITFQQVQKYEKGSNRVSASKLYEAAAVLRVEPGAFFDGLPATTEDADGETTRDPLALLLCGRENVAQAARVLSTLDAKKRAMLIDLITALAGRENDDEETVPDAA